ncbi:hypothetical protein ABK040_005530 [Willaertia magna]
MYKSNSLLLANILTATTLVVHTIVGDADHCVIEPNEKREENREIYHLKREKWTQSRCGLHWITAELILATAGMYTLNFTNYFEGHENFLKKLMSTCFLSISASWVATLLFSKPFPKRFLKLGQYSVLALIGGLLYNSLE